MTIKRESKMVYILILERYLYKGVKRTTFPLLVIGGEGVSPLYIYHHSEREVAIKGESKMVYILILKRCIYKG